MKDALGHGSDAHSMGMTALSGPMTHDIWTKLTPAQKDQHRDNSTLTPQLTGLEGHRVEATTHGTGD